MKSLLKLLSVPLVCAVLSACGRKETNGTSEPEQPELAEAATAERVIQLRAPKATANLWQSWGGKYVLYAHRSAGITSFSDLSGRSIMCAYINTDREPWVCDNVLGDMKSLQLTGGIPPAIGIQNNPEAYGKRLIEDETCIGFMAAGIAEHYELEDEAELVRFVIVE